MKNSILLILFVLLTINVFGQQRPAVEPMKPEATEVWEPVPRVVETGAVSVPAPSDAIILFDGSNLNEWVSANDSKSPAPWTITKDFMTVKAEAGGIKTKRKFGDVQLHIEFRTPAKVEGDGQGRGNSGVFFMERYEVQVLDNYENRTYSNGQCASIYKQHIPLVNACKKPGEWQTYDIIFMAPEFNKDGIKVRSGYATVIQNGVLVQNHVEIKGSVQFIGLPKNEAHGDASLVLQDHGNPVSFRNIWIREL